MIGFLYDSPILRGGMCPTVAIPAEIGTSEPNSKNDCVLLLPMCIK